MATLPYINLPQSQAPQILGDIGDSLVQAAQRSMQQKQQAIDNLLKQKQMEVQESQMRAQEARAQAEAARQEHYAIQEQHRYEHQLKSEAAGALKPMNEMFASGDTAGAMALGKIHGFDLSQKNILEDPGAAPQAPQPAPAGPIPTPADRDYGASQPGSPIGPDPSGAEQMALSDQQQAGDQQMASQQEQYAQALANHPQLVAQHAKRLADYKQSKDNPVYSGTGPFGAVEFNPGAVRQQKAQQQEQTAATLAQGFPPEYRDQVMAQVKSGATAGEVAQSIRLQMKNADDLAEKRRSNMSADQKFTSSMNNGNARRASAGAAPTPTGLSELIAMKEGGESDSKIALRAAAMGISPKIWTGPVKEVLRGGALNDRNERAKSALEITGPNGEKGTAHSVRDAGELNKKNQAFDQMAVRLQAAIDDIKKNGTRVNPLDVNATQRRESLMAAAAAAGRVYNGLGATDASQKLEAEINSAHGTLTHGFISGANVEVLQHNLEEAKRAHATAQAVRTKGGGQQSAASASAHPAAAPVGETKTLPNGQKIRKVGPNQWEPVSD